MVKLTCLASCTAVALLLFVTEPAFAEFQIQEAGIEKGEVELEYRGAYHWGVPQVTDTNENANDLVQSHEFELQMGITDWWLLSVTAGLDQPLGENLQGKRGRGRDRVRIAQAPRRRDRSLLPNWL